MFVVVFYYSLQIHRNHNHRESEGPTTGSERKEFSLILSRLLRVGIHLLDELWLFLCLLLLFGWFAVLSCHHHVNDFLLLVRTFYLVLLQHTSVSLHKVGGRLVFSNLVLELKKSFTKDFLNLSLFRVIFSSLSRFLDSRG